MVFACCGSPYMITLLFLLINLVPVSPIDYWQRRLAHLAPDTNPHPFTYFSPRFYVSSYLDPYVVLSAAGLIVCAAAGPPSLAWFLESRPMQLCGRISFGMYIYHHFLIQILHITDFRGHFGEHALLSILIYWPLSIGLAYVSFEFFERPLMAMARRRFAPPPSHIPMAACARSFVRNARASERDLDAVHCQVPDAEPVGEQ